MYSWFIFPSYIDDLKYIFQWIRNDPEMNIFKE